MHTAFLFPGQGSQSVGMMSEFYSQFSLTHALVEEANDTLGYNLWDIITQDETKLNKTIYTQPAMLLANIMTLRVIQTETDITAQVVAGHSLGELAALVAAEVVSFAETVKLVHTRATLMQDCVPEGVGSMAAILGLDDYVVTDVCGELSTDTDVVEAVNFNASGQVVIAGHTAQVAKACEVLKEKGAKRALVLPVSIPSHSRLMKPAGEEFLSYMSDISFNTPSVPLLHNIDGLSTTDSEALKANLAKQLYTPVQWVQTITNMSNDGITQYIEVGPGKVLTGLNKRIHKELQTIAVYDTATLATLQ